MVLDEAHIIDDDLAKRLADYGNGKCHAILLTDCCYSSSIWGIQSCKKTQMKLPPLIMSISAARGSQTAKQTKGIITYYFWKLTNDITKISAKQM